MSIEEQVAKQHTETLVSEIVNELGNLKLYEQSIHTTGGDVLFMVRDGLKKYLMVVPKNQDSPNAGFKGQSMTTSAGVVMKCELTHENAQQLRACFAFTNPVLIGRQNSYGFGDRLGNAGPAHLRAVKGTGFKPILAQQSIRELERTNRSAEEVMDAASWAVFQEGYHDGFGADGDHLKTTADIDRMVTAGYTFFTIDPSDFVVNEVRHMSDAELENAFLALPWQDLEDAPESLSERVLQNPVLLKTGYSIEPDRRQMLEGMVKYGRVITHTKMMAAHLAQKHAGHPAELELSVDETDAPTTLFEHYLIASELHRLGVELVSLAPRFCGDFEKGIDFKGDINQFLEEYQQHLAIAAMFGAYKLSIHSGSDKFTVYEAVGSLNFGAVHVKTAGTSYLEALRTIAVANPQLFREILAFSISRFHEDKKTYHISASLDAIKDLDTVADSELPEYLNDNHARQVLHVAYGSVLSGNLPEAKTFKERLMTSLEEHESLHEENLLNHFRKHLAPFTHGRK